MGNICRSPTAEGVFRHLVEQQKLTDVINTDSAGTHAYHVGEAPDRRAQSAANQRNIDLSDIRGRQFKSPDLENYDYVLAMDKSNYHDIQSLDDGDGKARVSLFLEYAEHYSETEVPDPYYGGANGFERVLDMVEDAAKGLLEHIRKQHRL